MLDNHDRLSFGQILQYPGHIYALMDVQERTYLVEEVEFRIARCRCRNGHPLQLSS